MGFVLAAELRPEIVAGPYGLRHQVFFPGLTPRLVRQPHGVPTADVVLQSPRGSLRRLGGQRGFTRLVQAHRQGQVDSAVRHFGHLGGGRQALERRNGRVASVGLGVCLTEIKLGLALPYAYGKVLAAKVAPNSANLAAFAHSFT